ncbi:cell envelope biogenesis protein OmpA [Echinicola rosea]|uniref:Cell envelope biogenesis protein OmpA n=1 Tax=Echinicola rosea TaxID=1807691 RepID=A0ABQ1UJ81_9BACT|nr:cell envelope biogenesis protein OmpA [Echinicola rosea]
MVALTANAQYSLLRYADQQKTQMNYKVAAEVYEKAYEKRPTYTSAQNAAFCHSKNNEYDLSIEWYKKAFAFSGEYTDEDITGFLDAALAIGQREEILDYLSENRITDKEHKPVNYKPVSKTGGEDPVKYLGDINSVAADFILDKDANGNRYFVSDRGEKLDDGARVKKLRFDAKNKMYGEEIYEWTGRDYLKIYRQDAEGNIHAVNTKGSGFMHVSDPSVVTVEGVDYMFFSVTRDLKDEVKSRDFEIQPELYYGAINKDGRLLFAQPFPRNSPLKYGLITPFADQETSRLYFASNMEGGYGGYDIYYVTYYKEGDRFIFSAPANLGERINSKSNERDPFAYKGKFYFASDGHSGYGGLDIFSARSLTGEVFGQAVNMGEKVNSVSDDFAYRQYGDEEIYISSNRKGEEGLDDIYQLLPARRKLLAKVMDCDGNVLENAPVVLHQIDGDSVEWKRKEEGTFLADLSAEQNYEIKIDLEGYFPVYDKSISSVGLDSGTIKRTYYLAKIPAADIAITEIIYYDLDRSLIRRTEHDILDDVVEVMKMYPRLSLDVSSHTDSRATDRYNQRLSKSRAKSVEDYMVGKGIPKERINVNWFGEGRLAVDCPDGKDCSEDQHQLNRRSELVLKVAVDDWLANHKEYKDYCSLTSSLDELLKKAEADKLDFEPEEDALGGEQLMTLERLKLFLQMNPKVVLRFLGASDQAVFEKWASMSVDYLTGRGISSKRLSKEWFENVEEVQGTKHQSRMASFDTGLQEIIIEIK